jgi:hypothetical protein
VNGKKKFGSRMWNGNAEMICKERNVEQLSAAVQDEGICRRRMAKRKGRFEIQI